MSQVGWINPETGHVTTEDDVALYRATLPDRPDPPSMGPQVRRFLSDQNTLFGGVPPPPDANIPGGGPLLEGSQEEGHQVGDSQDGDHQEEDHPFLQHPYPHKEWTNS
jgi:hypothetical protein